MKYFCLCCRVFIAAPIIAGRLLDPFDQTQIGIANKRYALRPCEIEQVKSVRMPDTPVICTDCARIPRDEITESYVANIAKKREMERIENLKEYEARKDQCIVGIGVADMDGLPSYEDAIHPAGSNRGLPWWKRVFAMC